MANISIVFHSRHGHTEQTANQLAEFIDTGHTGIHVIRVEDVSQNWQKLHGSDAIIFGSPTHFSNVSALFKAFMEETEAFWYKQPWKDKFAAAFTVSPTLGGDKQHTLLSLVLFAAQHSMHWISLGVLPRFINNQQTDGQNRLGSYLGLMIQMDNHMENGSSFHPGDMLTMELFAKRIVDVVCSLKTIKTDNVEAGQRERIPL